MLDLHNHTQFSPDSATNPEALIHAAIARHIQIFGITEHCDLDYFYYGMAYGRQLDIAAYLNTCQPLVKQYESSINLLLGIECGYDKHVTSDIEDLQTQFNFDYIINSVHLIDGIDPYYLDYFNHKPKVQALSRYLETVYESLYASYPYEIVGHLGYAARYAPYDDPKLYYHEFQLLYDKILIAIIKLEKVLEVNLRTQNCGYDSIPQYDVLKRYYELGGRNITLGSDAHCISDLDNQRFVVCKNLREIGFTELCWFKNRKLHTMSIDSIIL